MCDQRRAYIVFFEQGGSADIFSLISGVRDDTSKSVIVTLSNIWGGNCPPPPSPLGTYGSDDS